MAFIKIKFKRNFAVRTQVALFALVLLIASWLFEIGINPSHCDSNYYIKITHGIKTALFSRGEDSVYLDIPFKSLDSIKKERYEALKNGVLTKSQFYNAALRYKNEESAVKIRLKGDFLDHLEKMPWSFRLEMKENSFNGMKVFSLQRPEVRNGLVEPIFMAEARELGLIAPRYGFVHLYINGADMGVVAYEEHMGKELLEANGRKEAPILAFNDEDIWEYYKVNKNRFEVNPYQNINIVSSKYFDKKKTDADSTLSMQANFAINQIEDYQSGKKSFTQVFDVEKMYLAVVLADAWATSHPISWPNMKFYMNPFTLKLEPILFDNGHAPDFSEYSFNINNIYSIFAMELGAAIDNKLLDQSIRKVSKFDLKWYSEKLRNYKENVDIDSSSCMRFDFENILKNKNKMMADGGYYKFNAEVLKEFYDSELYQTSVRNINNRTFHKFVDASLDAKGYLTVRNIIPTDLDWLKVEVNCKDITSVLDVNKILPPTNLMFGAGKKSINIKDKINECGVGGVNSINVVTRLNDQVLKSNVNIRRLIVSDIVNKLEYDSKYFPKFILPSKDGYVVKAGSWKINEPILIPEGRSLTFEAGAKISFSSNGSLTINGPLIVNGDEHNSVIFSGLGGSPWGGVYVYKSRYESRLENLKIFDVGVRDDRLLSLTGALTFYESDVDFNNVVIQGVYSEDAINIVRSNFNINNVSIVNTKSDAIDSDFSTGFIYKSYFDKIGGDAIDTSGTKIKIKMIEISNVKDKAFSIGENSQAEINEVHVESVGTVVAVKDGSHATVDNIKVSEPFDNAFMAYRKKSEYGLSKLEVTAQDVLINKSVVQSGNKIIFNGIEMTSSDLNVKKLYSVGSMRKWHD